VNRDGVGDGSPWQAQPAFGETLFAACDFFR